MASRNEELCNQRMALESVLGRDSGGGVGAAPDAALTENREDIDILPAIENREYR